MIESTYEVPLPVEVEHELDALLAGWAQRQALPVVRAEAIRQEALRERQLGDTGLTYEWWSHFFAGVTATIRRTADVRSYLPAVA